MIIIKDKTKFVSLMNLVRAIVDEINITFSLDKIVVKAIHCSNSNILFLEINKEFFEKYEFEKETTYTISLDDLLKILKLCKEEIEIKPELDNIVFKSGKNNFKLSYFVGEKELREKPIFEHVSSIKINSKRFYCIINDCLTLDTIGNFKIENEDFKIDLKNYKVKSELHFENYSFLKKEELTTYFDLELLNLTSELKNIFKDVVIGLGKNLPLTLSCEDEVIKCEFVLANRVE